MIRSLVHSLVRPVVLGTALVAFVYAGTGCADVVVSSNHSRRTGLRHYASGEYVDAAGAAAPPASTPALHPTGSPPPRDGRVPPPALAGAAFYQTADRAT